MSMIRKIMRNIMRKGSRRTTLNGTVSVGTRRAGMHQAAEHAYRRAVMADGAPTEETPEEALEIPESLESEIPPEDINDQEAKDVAEGDAAVAPEAEILDEIADPEASINEEETDGLEEEQLSVDYSNERIPEMMPPVAGGVPADTPLVYDPGDGSLKEIQEPLPGMGERYGIPPLFNGIPDPSANVAAYDEPEPEPEPDPDTPDTPDTPGD